ncbi:MAG: glycosyltransferase family 4 protein [Saprospirales bacterium]|nr:glycosyltransferase family 4 protein [Saprospirales bacterium]
MHYIVWRALPGGAESYVTYYAERFAAERKIYVYSLRYSENKVSDSGKAHFQSGTDHNWACYRDYFFYCRRYKGHIFHLLSTGPITLLLALLAGVRHPVYHIHGTKYWKTFAEKLYLKTAWLISSLFRVTFIANSRYSAGIFHRDVLSIKPKVIYNGFATGAYLEKRFLRPELRRIAYIGRLHPGKNVELVLRLFGEVAAQLPRLELHIAGDGMLREQLESQAQSSPYRDRIIFHGWVEDIASFYQSIDLFLFLSAYESFGNVVLEALLTGLPVLTSDIPVFEEIHGGESAFLLGDPGNYEALKGNFLNAVAHFPDLAQRAYNLGGQIAGTFDMEKHLTEIEAVYLNTDAAIGLRTAPRRVFR